MRARFYTRLRQQLLLLSAGTIVFGIAEGCDTQTKTAVYGGLAQFANALTDAFFLQLEHNAGVTPNTTSTGTTGGSSSGSTSTSTGT